MGFIVSTLTLGTVESFKACILYLIIYIMISVNIFAVILCFRKIVSFSKIRHLIEFSTMMKSNYILAIIFSFILLSLAGIPPFAGFFGKIYVFNVFISSGYYFTAVFLVLMSILSCVYYIRLVRFIFFNDFGNLKPIFTVNISIIHGFLIIFTFIFNICFFFFQDAIIVYLDEIVLNYYEKVHSNLDKREAYEHLSKFYEQKRNEYQIAKLVLKFDVLLKKLGI